MTHITGTSATPVGVSNGIRITVNTGIAAGTITVTDNNGTQAIITNPVVGNAFEYFGFQGTITVTCSVAGDITVSNLSANRT